MWIRPLVLITVAILDLAVIGLLGVQWASTREVSWGVIAPTVVFNLFGAVIFGLAKSND
jgi:hypothetical protein